MVAREPVSREELYEIVWSEPVSRVAPRFGLSGAGLRKLCLRHAVPVPPRGSWAKVAAGVTAERARLPAEAPARRRVAWGAAGVLSVRASLPAAPVASVEVERQRAFEADPKHRIAVRESGGRLHPWGRELRTSAKGGRGNYRGLVRVDVARGAVQAEVSPGQVPRVARIVDALGWALAARGFMPAGTDRVVVQGVSFRVRLAERCTRSLRPQHGQVAASWSVEPRYAYLPTGQMVLTVNALETGFGEPGRVFRDAVSTPLEARLNAVMVALAEVAVEVRVRRLERLERERRRQVEEARVRELERRRAERAAEVRALGEVAERWARATRLRELIAAVETSGRPPHTSGAPVELAAWLAWARAAASELDPLLDAAGPVPPHAVEGHAPA
jgi:hypothetical protein